MPLQKPADIAHEALRRIAEAQLPPTPEHFSQFYSEIAQTPPAAPSSIAWPDLCRRLLNKWERSQAGLTHLQKIATRDRILGGSDAEEVARQLAATIQQWERMPSRLLQSDSLIPHGDGDCQPWRQLWITSLRHALGSKVWDALKAHEALLQVDALLAQTETTPDQLLPHIHKIWQVTDQFAQDDLHIREGLQQLISLLLNNVSDLVEDERWLDGQIHVIQAITRDVRNPAGIDQAIASVKEVLFQQDKLKSGVHEARQAIRDLIHLVLTTVDGLADQSGQVHLQLEQLAEALNTTEDWKQIRQIVASVVDTSKIIKNHAAETRDALRSAKARLQAAQARIYTLEEEMSAVSALVHVDPLTGALNRRGLEAAFAREAARAQRLAQPLAIAIIDLDHFKRVNDMYGHDLGDQVLRGVVQVLRDTLRGSDTFSRYGGEEFVLLMPDTSPEEALGILQRVQEQLHLRPFHTRDYPLHASFSGGISALRPGLTQDQTITLADEALYRAKHEGRRRIYLAAQANSST